MMFFVITQKYSNEFLSDPEEVIEGEYIRCSADQRILFLSEEQADFYFIQERKKAEAYQNRMDNI